MLEIKKETFDLIDNTSFGKNIENLTDEQFLCFCQSVVNLIENEILFHMELSEKIKDKYLDMEFNYIESSSYQREKEIKNELLRIKDKLSYILTNKNINMVRKAVIYLVENEIPFEINRMIQNGINKNNDDKKKEDNKVLKKKIINLSAN